MAGAARYTAILDANVLYPQLVRDLLLSLAACGLYHARWSADIHEEWTRNLKAKMPDLGPKVDAIVTFNLKDFPAEVLKAFDIEAQHPDEFVMNQLQLHEVRALTAVKEMRARWKNPSRSAEELLTLLEARGLPQTAEHLHSALGLI